MPISLGDDELRIVMDAAAPIPTRDRDPFFASGRRRAFEISRDRCGGSSAASSSRHSGDISTRSFYSEGRHRSANFGGKTQIIGAQ
jgi:hypothetical protein